MVDEDEDMESQYEMQNKETTTYLGLWQTIINDQVKENEKEKADKEAKKQSGKTAGK